MLLLYVCGAVAPTALCLNVVIHSCFQSLTTVSVSSRCRYFLPLLPLRCHVSSFGVTAASVGLWPALHGCVSRARGNVAGFLLDLRLPHFISWRSSPVFACCHGNARGSCSKEWAEAVSVGSRPCLDPHVKFSRRQSRVSSAEGHRKWSRSPPSPSFPLNSSGSEKSQRAVIQTPSSSSSHTHTHTHHLQKT